MRKYVVLGLKIVGGMTAVLLVVLVAAGIVLNTSAGQQRLLKYSVELLQDKLQTKVTIDSISVNFLTFDVNLIGVDVEDRQQRKMLQADRVAVSLHKKALLSHQVEVKKAEIEGVRARLYHPKDSAANYQFAIDAFKSDNTDRKDEKEEKKNKLSFNISTLLVSKIDIEQHGITKKGYQQTNHCFLGELKLRKKGDKQLVSIDSLCFSTNNHQPRKNAGKPHRGAFDAGHLDITANLELSINHIGKDTANISLTKFVATDPTTGFNVKDLRLEAGISKEAAYLGKVTIQQESTVLSFDSATVVLPNKKEGRKLAYHTSVITGKALLKDIAKPFSPALSRFSIPLELKVILSGTDSTMQFKNVHVNTTDQKLKIDAEGNIAHLKEAEKLAVRFHVKKMSTHAQTVKNIIDQFVVKKFMMKQLNNLGSISYAGDFDILYKREWFRGLLNTSAGKINFDFTINEKTQYIQGNTRANSFQLGKVIEMKDIGDVACRANFSFDISKQRTAKARKMNGGKLPIGSVKATEISTTYKKIKLYDIDATIKSDGAIAQGHLSQKNKVADLLCDFTFTSTDAIHKMKIKPSMKLNILPWKKKK